MKRRYKDSKKNNRNDNYDYNDRIKKQASSKKEQRAARNITKGAFYTKKECDRCGGSLENGRTLSMFNMDCICVACKKEEVKHPNYEKARSAELAEIKKGNYNFEGIGYTPI